ncbi:MAG TPA: hypothetical protein DD435_01860 [Cyanobacteria bacterium UBA8530]|nr:hypothetical protein [Cyanobacteria bacterium UBA8530]
MKKRTAVLIGAIALLGAACGKSPLSSSPNVENAVVADGGQYGGKSISIAVLPPAEGGFRTQAQVHRWVENDIYEYRAALQWESGGGYQDLSPALSLTLPRKGDPKSKAVFRNLAQGKRYRVSLTAWGNQGGLNPSQKLNSALAAVTFDFTASQDVEDNATASLLVAFDAVDFNGTGEIGVGSPSEGGYQNPSLPETGEAQ